MSNRRIAIVGMACRFPGANSPAEFWENLRRGIESITFFSDNELLAAGVDPAILRNPSYVKAAPVLRDIDKFDAAFFGYSPKEAAILDPQHRLFLETCWEAFEDAGYDPDANASEVGVFAAAGSALTSYLFAHAGHPDMRGQTASVQHIDNDKDFLSTRVSFKLNLTGPSVTVQTACSSSLVALHLACQSLLNGECDMAVAGASTVRVPHMSGYFAERGSVHSSDGHCRAFDAGGTGTIFGSGVAAVVLKPLPNALDDGDHVYAVVAGSAINNDGSAKISYSAASTTGQARAIVEALDVAEVAADSIDYVECHATGTIEGDPVEIQALRRAFAIHRRKRACAIGSVKTNIGHPEQAAGLAGLIKTALALKHHTIPPSLHFSKPNPRIPFDGGPFYVQAALGEWPHEDRPRRAGINSLGIGGTNAFVVLEEAPELPTRHEEQRKPLIFSISAKARPALRTAVERTIAYLDGDADATIRDICYTANVSRSRHAYRFAEVCSTKEELRSALTQFLSAAAPDSSARGPRIAFLFSGQGTAYAGIAGNLYHTVSAFRDALDRCDELFQPRLERSVRHLLLFNDETVEPTDTAAAQAALFALQYALAETWRSYGITPAAVLGHSVGEIAAACVAGVLNLADAAEFVATRGALMQGMAAGVMEAFFADETRVRDAIDRAGLPLDIAAINAPQNTVVAGRLDDVEGLRRRLYAEGIASRPLTVSRAFHSALIEPILDRLEAAARRMPAGRATVPCISNVTGTPMDGPPPPAYWRDHARRPVRFADGLQALDRLGCEVFLELGPGSALLAIGRQCLPKQGNRWLASISAHRSDSQVLEGLAALYSSGHDVDWQHLWKDLGPARRVSLPTYPFERRRFWLDGAPPTVSHQRRESDTSIKPANRTMQSSREELAKSFYHVSWIERPDRMPNVAPVRGAWLVFADSDGLAEQIEQVLGRDGRTCHLVFESDHFSSPSPRRWTVDAREKSHVARLLQDVARCELGPFPIVLFLGALDCPITDDMTADVLNGAATSAPRRMLNVVQALSESNAFRDSRLWVITRGAHIVAAPEATDPTQGLLWGMGRTFALERPSAWGGMIDLSRARVAIDHEAHQVVRTITSFGGEQQVALRDDGVYVARLRRFHARQTAGKPVPVYPDGTYLITGGLGMLGLQTAKWLVERHGARSVVLVSRHPPSAAAAAEVAALEARGAQIRSIAADVADEEEIGRVLQDVRRELPQLKGITHCAGVLADSIVTRMNWTTFERALAAKVRGTWVLHRHTRDLDLDFFVVHSSLLSLTGSIGQSNYTAANAFLDAFVAYRHAQGLPATTINWGPWGGGGMAIAANDRSEETWRRQGITLIEPPLGLDALDYLFTNGAASTAFAVCDWRQYVSQLPRPSTFFAELVPPSDIGRQETMSNAPGRRTSLVGLASNGRREMLLDALRSEVTRELRLESDVDTREPLHHLGVDSLMSVNLANRLEARLGMHVPVATIVRGPSVEELTDQLLDGFAEDGMPLPEGPHIADKRFDHLPPRSVTRENGWLVFPRPNESARVRLFCFNFAGGGAASFRPWSSLLAPWIELIVIEPPGRGARIDEPSLSRLDAVLERLMPAMAPYLDRPAAFFGHCLGALTLFESTRHLIGRGFPDLVHLFVSGARPPDRVDDSGRFEEDLLATLLKDNSFDPLRPFHEQPDDTFATLLRQFNIWATDDFLTRPELRALLLPAIRADFKAAASYRYVQQPPWEIPITCFCGLDDPYVTRQDAVAWHRHTTREFRIHFRRGNHFLVVEDRDFIISEINSVLRPAGLT